jgi:hypothetical protein
MDFTWFVFCPLHTAGILTIVKRGKPKYQIQIKGYMAYRRMGCRARCAIAFDELRRHAAVERSSAQLQQFFPVFFDQHSV